MNGCWVPIFRTTLAVDAMSAMPNTIIGIAQPQPLALEVLVV